MCGRFHLTQLSPDFEEMFQRLFGIPFPRPVYPTILEDDILPFRDITTIYRSHAHDLVSRPMYWNLIPKNAPRFEAKGTWFNTRKEKLEEPYQKTLLKYKRCLIPVNGFFENKRVRGQPVYHSATVAGRRVRRKERYEFVHKDQPLMLLGAIYDIWRKGDQFLQYSCSIITLEPNSLIGQIHDRMPFIVPNESVKPWLDRTIDDADLMLELIRPYGSDRLERTQVWPKLQAQQTLF